MTTDTIDDLKDAIKVKKTPKFDDIATDELTLWRVSVPVIAAEKHEAVVLHTLHSKEELLPTDELSDVFKETPPKKTIHIIVQRPPPGNGIDFFAQRHLSPSAFIILTLFPLLQHSSNSCCCPITGPCPKFHSFLR